MSECGGFFLFVFVFLPQEVFSPIDINRQINNHNVVYDLYFYYIL